MREQTTSEASLTKRGFAALQKHMLRFHTALHSSINPRSSIDLSGIPRALCCAWSPLHLKH